MNSLAAGCVAGTVVAIHTRNAPVVALSAALSGVLMVGVDAGAAAAQWAVDQLVHQRGKEGHRSGASKDE